MMKRHWKFSSYRTSLRSRIVMSNVIINPELFFRSNELPLEAPLLERIKYHPYLRKNTMPKWQHDYKLIRFKGYNDTLGVSRPVHCCNHALFGDAWRSKIARWWNQTCACWVRRLPCMRQTNEKHQSGLWLISKWKVPLLYFGSVRNEIWKWWDLLNFCFGCYWDEPVMLLPITKKIFSYIC